MASITIRILGGMKPGSGDEPGTRLHAEQQFREGNIQVLVATEQERGPNFLRLANALSALYPRGNHEKRVLDAMLLAVSRSS